MEPTHSASGGDADDIMDDHWMQHALDLARKGRCGASPNPMVGAIVLMSAYIMPDLTPFANPFSPSATFSTS